MEVKLEWPEIFDIWEDFDARIFLHMTNTKSICNKCDKTLPTDTFHIVEELRIKDPAPGIIERYQVVTFHYCGTECQRIYMGSDHYKTILEGILLARKRK